MNSKITVATFLATCVISLSAGYPLHQQQRQRHNVQKRGVPVSGANSQDQANANAYAQQAGDEALNQIRDSSDVADRSARTAVGNSVGKDYSNQLATTAQFVAQFAGAPVTKEQAQRTFDTVGNFQKASSISSALANAGGAIWRAANSAASSNYQQALQAENAGYSRTSGGGHYGGGGSGGSGGGRSSGYGR